MTIYKCTKEHGHVLSVIKLPSPNRGTKCCNLAFVRLHISKRHRSKLHKIFRTCHPWPWLGPPLTTMQYVMYFLFCRWHHVFMQWAKYREAWSLQHSKLFTVTSKVVLLNYALRDKVCYCLVITLRTHPTPVFQSTSQQYAFGHFPHCDKNKKWQHCWKLMNIPTFSGMLACRRTWQTLLLFRK